MRPGPKKVSAFATAGEQQQALEAWRARATSRAAKVDGITHKISNHKKQARQTTERSRWLADRDALNKEQDTCEAQLFLALHPLLPLLKEDLVAEAAATQELRREVQDHLGRLRGCVHALSKITSTERSPKHAALTSEMRQCLLSVREFLSQVRKELTHAEQDLVELSDEGPSGGSGVPGPPTTVDFPALFAVTRQRCVDLRRAYPGPDFLGIHDAFQQALSSEEERCTSRLTSSRPSASSSPATNDASLTPQVLSSVALIVKMADNARKMNVSASTSREVTERVAQAFPHLQPHEITAAVEECRWKRASQQRQRLAALDYKKAVAALFATYTAALTTRQQSLGVEQEMEEERLERLSKQAQMHERLAEQRAVYEETQQIRRAEEEMLAAAELRRREVAEALRARELQERLGHLAAFMQAREAERKKQAEIAALRAGEEAERKAAQMAKNKERVAYRNAEYEEKEAQRAARERDLVQLREAKEAALGRFFAAVERQLDVQPSRERLLQGTEASKQTTAYVPLAQAVQASAAALDGYSDEQIMRDPRVRLYQALMEAGLHKTAYGREVASRGFHVAPAQRTSADNPFF